MSQINVNDPGPGGPYYHDDAGGHAAAAGINLLAVILIIAVLIAIAVVAWGAYAGHWFGGNGGYGNNNAPASAPAGTQGGSSTSVTINAPSPAASR